MCAYVLSVTVTVYLYLYSVHSSLRISHSQKEKKTNKKSETKVERKGGKQPEPVLFSTKQHSRKYAYAQTFANVWAKEASNGEKKGNCK